MVSYTGIKIIGNSTNGGCYLLVIYLAGSMSIKLGRYNQGKAVHLPAGDYLYIGSARAEKGPSSLGARLLRHATRSGTHPPHIIRPRLGEALCNAGLPAQPPSQKRLHWHIDYLLDQPQAEIQGVIALRSLNDHENQIAEKLAHLPETALPAKGLGASDHPGGTHLFQVQAAPDWWHSLPENCLGLINPGD